MGRVVRWNRKARVNYVHCRTGKGNLQAWRHVLDDDQSDQCWKCGRYAETGKHVALVCIHGEDIGRKWGTWEAMDGPERWRKKVRDPDMGRGSSTVTILRISFVYNLTYRERPGKRAWRWKGCVITPGKRGPKRGHGGGSQLCESSWTQSRDRV